MYRAYIIAGLLFAANLFTVSGVQAQTDYYVVAGGTGAKNGADWNNAYSDLPASLQRGAVYYIATGTYGPENFTDKESGTNTITLKKATTADHGTATGWVASYGTGQAVWPYWTIGNASATVGYYVFEGATRGAGWTNGYGFKIQNNGQKYSLNLNTGLSGGLKGEHLTFDNLEIQGNGMDSSTSDIGVYSFGCYHITFENCYLHDFGNDAIQDGYDQYWTIEYSVIARNTSTPALHGQGWEGEYDDNMTICYNIWSDIEGTGYIVALARESPPVAVVDSNYSIYGNVFMYSPGNPYHRDGVGDGVICALDDSLNSQIAQNWLIYNNDFINVQTGISGEGVSSGIEIGRAPIAGTPANSNVQIYNNYWWSGDPATITLGNCTNCTADYNRYDGNSGNGGPHDQVVAKASTSVFVNYTNANFELTADTQPGLTLASPFNFDLDGVVRGSDGIWDRGAFQLGGTVTTSPSPSPAILNISLAGNQMSIAWSTNIAAGFELESTTNPTSASSWVLVSTTPSVVGSQAVVTLPIVSGSRFFRLVQ